MARRLYLGRLPSDARQDDVEKLFEGYGRVLECTVKTGFGFVEFENSKDAEDAVQNFNGKNFMGSSIVVEFAKESRSRRDPYDDRGTSSRARRPPGIRVLVSGVSRDTSWQDLKDFGRNAGSVSFADIDRDVPGQGILEYLSRDDAERACKELDGTDLRGRPVRVTLDDTRGSVDNYRREDRYREDRYREDRHRDDRFRDDRYRRDRSRSPPRRDYDDRRYRSPPRKDFEDRRAAGYDDYRRGGDIRRDPDYYYDRRRDDYDRRREDKRRDEKDERYDDRSKHANGEGYR
ncbi:hypothetical protein K435DRAFT_741147 [Dendrothele bispora CBS 962.96]|uniref:RRM domain-containing protein n=1 Tax=Dendrothele bispora (strain CBS 962.96) TaxID=1314807 RepID=A0A4S8MYI8_DENBC|nr:hypothetical protein K435DRAFT_741147 [Dendrothele bispora CBS 962.96]